jgi:hypothetical protein
LRSAEVKELERLEAKYRTPSMARCEDVILHRQTVRPRQVFAVAGDKQYAPVPYLAFHLDPIFLNFTAD